MPKSWFLLGSHPKPGCLCWRKSDRVSEVQLTVMDQQLSPSLLRTADRPISKVHSSLALHPTCAHFFFHSSCGRSNSTYSRRQNPVLPILLRSPEISLFIAMTLWGLREYFLSIAGFHCGFSMFLILIWQQKLNVKPVPCPEYFHGLC